MEEFKYHMPVEVYFGKNIIREKSEVFKAYSGTAFIITGKGSSKKNGSLEDILYVLKKEKINHIIFDEVEENPSLETIDKAAELGRYEDAKFIIAIGGGSPLDAAKAIGLLIKNIEFDARGLLTAKPLKSLPIIAVPTTAGTGSEVTQYSIVTDNINKTKVNLGQFVFADIAFLDPKYMMDMPYRVTVATALDAFSHLAEGYLSTKANLLSDTLAQEGLRLFSSCLKAIINNEITYEIREKLMLLSSLGGMTIAQTGTSLPHGMGYPLTYFKGLSHGIANCILYKEYFSVFKNNERVNRILELIGLSSIEEMGRIFHNLIDYEVEVTEEELRDYAKAMASNPSKLKNHPESISLEDIFNIYYKSLVCK